MPVIKSCSLCNETQLAVTRVGWSTQVRPMDGSPPQHFDDLIYGRLSPDGKWLARMAGDINGFQIGVSYEM